MKYLFGGYYDCLPNYLMSKYTNSDCCAMLKCRLHCCYESVGGVLYQGYIKSPLHRFFTMSSSLKSFKEKKTRLF